VPEGKAALMFEVMSITENASHESFRGSLRSSSKQVPSNPSPNGVMRFFVLGGKQVGGALRLLAPLSTRSRKTTPLEVGSTPPVSAVLSTRRFTSTGYPV